MNRNEAGEGSVNPIIWAALALSIIALLVAVGVFD